MSRVLQGQVLLCKPCQQPQKRALPISKWREPGMGSHTCSSALRRLRHSASEFTRPGLCMETLSQTKSPKQELHQHWIQKHGWEVSGNVVLSIGFIIKQPVQEETSFPVSDFTQLYLGLRLQLSGRASVLYSAIFLSCKPTNQTEQGTSHL